MARTIYLPKQKDNILNKILEEVRGLRQEVSLFLPQENLEDYSNPKRLKKSYEKALRKFPPRS